MGLWVFLTELVTGRCSPRRDDETLLEWLTRDQRAFRRHMGGIAALGGALVLYAVALVVLTLTLSWT